MRDKAIAMVCSTMNTLAKAMREFKQMCLALPAYEARVSDLAAYEATIHLRECANHWNVALRQHIGLQQRKQYPESQE
jgi:hypothetical protein